MCSMQYLPGVDNSMLDDLNELKTFHRILTEGSLSGAARSLGVGLGVVSKRLATLERRTGARLIHRTTRSLSPTEEGARLATEIARALEALAAGEEALTSGRNEPFGTLRVSAPTSVGRRHVAPVLGSLAARFPRLDVALMLGDHLADPVSEALDVVIRVGEPADSRAAMRKLADNPRILVASPAYLDRAGRPETPHDLQRHMLIRHGMATTTWHFSGPGGQTVDVPVSRRMSIDNGDAAQDWALAGYGIMLKSEMGIGLDLSTGALERVLPDWTGGAAPIVALYPSSRHLALKTRIFIDEMAARLRNMRRATGKDIA